MKNYETVFIATPVLSEAQVEELFSKFQGVITENGGQIVSTENWGLRKLAYPIAKKTTGYYLFIEFEALGTIVDQLEILFKRDEKVIRFLTVKQEKYALEYAGRRREKIANAKKQ